MGQTRQLHIYFDSVVFAVFTRETARTRHDTLISSDTAASDWPWGSKTRPQDAPVSEACSESWIWAESERVGAGFKLSG